MKIQINVDLTVPRWLKNTVLAGVGLGVVAGLGLGVRAYAEPVPTVPASFASGETLTAAKLNASFAAVAALVNQANDPACAIGYTQDTTVTTFTLCKKGSDEVVKVGTGGAAFWIDRYEASVWAAAGGGGAQYGIASDTEYPTSFPKNGEYSTPLYAASKTGVRPSAFLTWYQAAAACQGGGKRLPTDQEWLLAARKTPDPGAHPGTGGVCVTSAAGPRNTGGGTACRSAAGAEDMIGNVWEWTADWYAGLGNATTSATQDATIYQGDGTWNITSSAYGGTSPILGLPSVAIRGGAWFYGTISGRFALNLDNAPSSTSNVVGFRCLLPR